MELLLGILALATLVAISEIQRRREDRHRPYDWAIDGIRRPRR
jgi:hypothetical protein